MISVCIAFDTATAFAMSFGISKFSLAQIEAKLVGEIVGRHGRSPNPAIVRSVLEPLAGKRSPPAPHAKTIHNAAQVRAALKEAGMLAYFRD